MWYGARARWKQTARRGERPCAPDCGLAALVTVLEAVHTLGLDGSTPTRRTVGTFGAAWQHLLATADGLDTTADGLDTTADGLDTTVTLDAEAEPVSSNTRTAAMADSQHAQVGRAKASSAKHASRTHHRQST
jgi:hypothetical protein